MDTSGELWVGASRVVGGLTLVYDPAIQGTGSTNVNLYSTGSNSITAYPRKIRWNLRTVQGPKREAAIERYLTWKHEHADAFLAEARTLLEEKRLALLAKHQRYMESKGIAYMGTRDASAQSHRVTYCHSCTEVLAGSFDISCMACGWLVCNACGACGCGHPKSRAAVTGG